MEKIAFIINPKSSSQNISTKIKKIQNMFPKSRFFFSKDKYSTHNFIQKNWDKIDIFVVVGGDGTVSSVASHLINSDKKLAIFPSGSGNGFAKETNFQQDINQLHTKLKEGNSRVIDTFFINEHFGINVAGVGFDAFIAKEFEHTQRGFWNYIKICIRYYFSFQGISITLETENGQKISGRYFFVSIANSRQFGNNAYIAPNAQLNDGLLDIVLVKKTPFWKTLQFIYQLFNKKIHTHPDVQSLQSSSFQLYSNTDIWHIDGDYLSIPSPVKIRVLEKSLHIIR